MPDTATRTLDELEAELAAVKGEIGTTNDPSDLDERLDEIEWQLERLRGGGDGG